MTEEAAIDQDQHATVSSNTLPMDLNASNAQPDKLLLTKTEPVSQLQPALVTTNISEMPTIATNVEFAKKIGCHLKIEEAATDQDQHAHALRNILLMDINASHAQLDKLVTQVTLNVSQLQHALVKVKSLVLLKTVINANIAKMV